MGRAAQLSALGVAVGFALWCVPAVSRTQEVHAAPLRSGCEFDYGPFCMVRIDGQADGFSVDLLEAALAAVGREVDFRTATWSEILGDLATGRLEVLPMVARTPEREATFDFTFPYLTMHGTIVVRSDTLDISEPRDLAGRRVAVLRDDVAHEYLREANLGAEIIPLPSFAIAMRELSEGRHDAVVIQKLLAFELMRELGLTNLRVVGPPLDDYTQVLCFAVRKGNAPLLSLLNEGLSIVMVDGTYRRLHAKWFADLETIQLRRSRIVVGGDANYPPYEYLDANGVPAGFVVDLTRAIARHMGLSVDIHLAPWHEVRAALDQGSIDALEGMFYSDERDGRFDFTMPHTLVQQVAVVRRGAPEIANLEGLVGKSVVVMDGDLMHDLLVQRHLAIDLAVVVSQEDALRELAEGKHDTALVARVPALYWIEKNGWNNLRVSSEPLLTAEYCFAVPHGAEVPLAAFAEGLSTLRQTGEFREIQNRWLAPYDPSPVELATIAGYVLIGLGPLVFLLVLSVLWSRSLQATVRRRTLELEYANEAFQTAEERLRLALEAAFLISFEWDIQRNEVRRFVSSEPTLAVAEDGSPGTLEEVRDRVHPEDQERFMGNVGAALERPDGMYQSEFRIVRPDGDVAWLSERGRVERDGEGRPLRLLGLSQDVTDRKRAEQEIRDALEEKSVLLREVHHRVKNNLQVISSLVNLQAESVSDPALREVFDDVRDRVRSMALVHEQLYQSESLAEVDFADYVRLLVRQLLRAHSAARREVVLQLHTHPLALSVEIAVPCGLILNELAGNALKHAFVGRTEGRLTVELVELPPGGFRLVVGDDGRGMPEGFDWRSTPSLGLRLVQMLSEQIGATVDVVTAPGEGTRVTIVVQDRPDEPEVNDGRS